MSKPPIIDALSGQRIQLSTSLFMNELLLDEHGRKVDPKKVKRKSYYYSLSAIPDGRHPNLEEVDLAVNIIEKYINCNIINIRRDIVALHNELRIKMRTFRRHVFIIRTHPLFEKVKKPQVFKKLSELIEKPLKRIEKRIEECSDRFKKKESDYYKFFPKKPRSLSKKLKTTTSLEESEGEIEEDDPFLKELQEHERRQKKEEKSLFNEFMEEDDDENKILLPMSSSSSSNEEEQDREKEQELEDDGEFEKIENVKSLRQNLRTPVPKQSNQQKKISQLIEWALSFLTPLRTLKKTKSAIKKCEFRPHVPPYIFSLLEEIRRREKVLRSVFYRVQDLQASLERENEFREAYRISGQWKRKKEYEKPTEEETDFLRDQLNGIDVSKVLDARYLDLFQSTADGTGLEEMVSPIAEIDVNHHHHENNKKKKDFGYITTEDLLECLDAREAQLAQKDAEIAEKEKKIQKLALSLGETQTSHDDQARQAREALATYEKLTETMLEEKSLHERQLMEQKKKYVSLELQSSQMEMLYNQKIEELEMKRSQQQTDIENRISAYQEEIENKKRKYDEMTELTKRYELEKQQIQEKIRLLEENNKKLLLSETISLEHQTSTANLKKRVEILNQSLEDSLREGREANRKYENGMKFVGNVVQLIDQKDEKIVKLEKIVGSLLKQLQKYIYSEE